MLAVRLEQYGSLPTVIEVTDPKLTNDLDVVVKVEGAGLCRTDLHAYEGQLADVFPAPLPLTLGHETAGRIAGIGRAVRGFEIGDKVILHPLQTCGFCPACRRGDDMQCADSTFTGLAVDGGMAEYVRTTARALVPLEDGTDTQAIAPLADAGLTAYHSIKKAVGQLTAESTCVVLGCGGLGHLAIQMIRAMTDSTIIGVDPSETARTLATDIGANHVAGADAREVVAQVTAGNGATAVFDFVGEADTPRLALDLLAARGSYFVVGYGGEIQLPTMEAVLKEIRIEGNIVGTYQDLKELVALYERGLLDCVVIRYPLAQSKQAFIDLESGNVRGRAVLVP